MPIDQIPSTGLSANVITLSANSSSIQNVNSVNFINTSSVTVTVSQGATSNVANVAINNRVTSAMMFVLGG
jgi:hypothetical protein